MMIRFLSVLGLLLFGFFCSGQKLESGLQIEYGPNLGALITDDDGTKYFYVHETATITNDTIIPVKLKLGLSGEYPFPDYCGDTINYRVFLLPRELTPDTATIYNDIVNGQHDFFNRPPDSTSVFEVIIDPAAICVVTIGVLIPQPSNCAAVPRAIFSYDDSEKYNSCDILQNHSLNTDIGSEIAVKLEYYNQRKFISPEDGCVTIPFGQISYPNYKDE